MYITLSIGVAEGATGASGAEDILILTSQK